jgi:uncharacterized protein (TIGR03086 family)
MVTSDDDIAATHQRVCARFGRAVFDADSRWDRPSPCEGWDARAVLEHVIGFHDVLLLRPLEAKPQRPRDDPAQRWRVTVDALRNVFERPGLFDGVIDVPAVGEVPASRIDARTIVPLLSQEVLVHTWDLARATGGNDRLDPRLCAQFLAALPADADQLARTGMYREPVDISEGAGAQEQLLACLGRDPSWPRP